MLEQEYGKVAEFVSAVLCTLIKWTLTSIPRQPVIFLHFITSYYYDAYCVYLMAYVGGWGIKKKN